MTMNSQGLDALAALASATPSSATNNVDRGSSNGAMCGQSPNSDSAKSEVTTDSSGPAAQMATRASNEPNASSSQSAQAQNWQPGIASMNQSAFVAQNLAMLAGMQPRLAQPDSSALMAMQQIAYYQYLMQAQSGNPGSVPQQAKATFPASGGNCLTDVPRPSLKAQVPLQPATQVSTHEEQPVAVLPKPTPTPVVVSAGSQSSSAGSSVNMPPPPQPTLPSTQAFSVNTTGVAPPGTNVQPTLAPLPTSGVESRYEDYSSDGLGSDKKTQKRAANRRSAQLSRKRKKQFIEELKDENDELRRKEQILLSIPDLIIVFDSTGKIWFVSQSISRFLDFSVDELEGSSFWNRLCEDSVRLLKAAFMDSLAARKPGSDTASLGSGIWELRLVDKDGAHKVVTLNGVVHFAGDRPECVCSIRPREPTSHKDSETQVKREQSATCLGSEEHSTSNVRVESQQSILNPRPGLVEVAPKAKGASANRISEDSESGSGDDLATA